MNIKKKILILKQTEKGFSLGGKDVSAILRIEEESGVSCVFLSVINIAAACGEYFLYILDCENKLFCFSLGKKPASFNEVFIKKPAINGDISAGIVFVANDLPVLVAFSTEKTSDNAMPFFKKHIADKCLAEYKEKQLAAEVLSQSKSEKTSAPIETKSCCADEKNLQKNISEKTDNLYNDEAVATENYFEIDESINQKIKTISEIDNDLLRNKDVVVDNSDQKETQKNERFDSDVQNEKAVDSSEKFSDDRPYYFTAKRELDKLFDNFPEENSLCKLFPESKWVKVSYSEQKYYVVGIVYENKKVKYICYGIPSDYSEQEPEELKGFCSFIPLSVFDMKGKGYYMMFQDAVSGECVKKLSF